jgi:hypothetical protein
LRNVYKGLVNGRLEDHNDHKPLGLSSILPFHYISSHSLYSFVGFADSLDIERAKMSVAEDDAGRSFLQRHIKHTRLLHPIIPATHHTYQLSLSNSVLLIQPFVYLTVEGLRSDEAV